MSGLSAAMQPCLRRGKIDRSRFTHFEPLPARRRALTAKAPPNYIVQPYAVSDRDGTAQFWVNSFDAASSLLTMDEPARQAWIDGHLLHEDERIYVGTIRLDTFMCKRDIADVEFLKID